MRKTFKALAGLSLFVLAILGCIAPSEAQTSISALVTATCGTPGITLTAGRQGVVTQNTGGQLCVNATVSASVAGFSSNGSFGSLTATPTTSASTALPSGTVTRITNTSSTATVSCTEATGAATGVVNNIIVEPGSSVSRVNGAFDHIACIDQTGSTGSNLVILEGGAGLGNDSGGGGSGGGGSSGAVFGPTAVGSANANPPVVIGGTVTGAAGQNVEGVAVKPASTASLATDFSLVTNESPNSQLSVAIGTSADTPCTLPATTTTCSLIAVQKAAANNIIAAVPVSVNGTATALTGLTPGSAQTGTIIAVNQDVTSWHGTALGAPSAYGTSPGAVTVPGVNSFITNTVAISGSLTANQSVNVAQFGGVSTATGQVAVSTAPVTATNTALVVDLRPDSPGIITLGPAAPANAVPTIPSSPYPGNATAVAVPINASSGNVAAGTAAATLAAAGSKFTYMSGFQFTSSGSTVGLPVICTITGITTTKSYIVTSVAGVLLANAPLIVQFNPPLQSSAVNTAIVASCPSLGTGNTNAVMTADGFQL